MRIAYAAVRASPVRRTVAKRALEIGLRRRVPLRRVPHLRSPTRRHFCGEEFDASPDVADDAAQIGFAVARMCTSIAARLRAPSS